MITQPYERAREANGDRLNANATCSAPRPKTQTARVAVTETRLLNPGRPLAPAVQQLPDATGRVARIAMDWVEQSDPTRVLGIRVTRLPLARGNMQRMHRCTE